MLRELEEDLRRWISALISFAFRLFSFKGTAGRIEFVLVYLTLSVGSSSIVALLVPESSWRELQAAAYIGIKLGLLPTVVRRFRDIGHSSQGIVMGLVFYFIPGFATLVFLLLVFASGKSRPLPSGGLEQPSNYLQSDPTPDSGSSKAVLENEETFAQAETKSSSSSPWASRIRGDKRLVSLILGGLLLLLAFCCLSALVVAWFYGDAVINWLRYS